jgi:two-component system LytT family response regulator
MQNNYSRITITTCDGCYFFSPEEIVRLEASSNYTNVFFTNRKKMLIAKVLKDYETMLEPLHFVRTHRSHLVNSQHVQFIDSNGRIIMRDSSRVEISRRKKKDVLKELKKCLEQVRMAA